MAINPYLEILLRHPYPSGHNDLPALDTPPPSDSSASPVVYHRLIRVCIDCNFDSRSNPALMATMKHLPSYKCPSCDGERFAFKCDVCAFNLTDNSCPLVRALNGEITGIAWVPEIEIPVSSDKITLQSQAKTEDEDDKIVDATPWNEDLIVPSPPAEAHYTLEFMSKQKVTLEDTFRTKLEKRCDRFMGIEGHTHHRLDTIYEEPHSSESDSDSGNDTPLAPRMGGPTLRRLRKSQNLRLGFSVDPDLEEQTFEAVAMLVQRIEPSQLIYRDNSTTGRVSSQASNSSESMTSSSAIITSSPAPEHVNNGSRVDGQDHSQLSNSIESAADQTKTTHQTEPDKVIETTEDCPYCKMPACPACPPEPKTICMDMTVSKTFTQDFIQCSALCKHNLCTKTVDKAIFRCSRCQHDECDNCEEMITHRVEFHPDTIIGEAGRILAVEKDAERFCVCCQCIGQRLDWARVTMRVSRNQVKFVD
jgi:hypothetical protein